LHRIIPVSFKDLVTGNPSTSMEVFISYEPMAYPEIFSGGEASTNSVENRGQRERGSGGGSPLVRGSGGSRNLVEELSFHIVKFS